MKSKINNNNKPMCFNSQNLNKLNFSQKKQNKHKNNIINQSRKNKLVSQIVICIDYLNQINYLLQIVVLRKDAKYKEKL